MIIAIGTPIGCAQAPVKLEYRPSAGMTKPHQYASSLRFDVVPIQIKFEDKYNYTDFSTIDTGAWEIFLEYKDIFGNDYHTKYTKAGKNFFAGSFKGSRPPLEREPAEL